MQRQREKKRAPASYGADKRRHEKKKRDVERQIKTVPDSMIVSVVTTIERNGTDESN
jgi:hypothetical protein